MITTTVATGYSTAGAAAARERETCTIAMAHHSDQAVCSEGIAAYWFDTEAIGDAPEAYRPSVLRDSTVSTKPGSMRGGARGNSQKPTSASTVVAKISRR